MTHQDKGHFSKKHDPQRKPAPKVLRAVKERQADNQIPCAVAFAIADELNVSPEEVGFTVDFLELHIVKCQLGLYGYQPDRKKIKSADSVPRDLEDALRGNVISGRLPCEKAWEIAKAFGVSKMTVSSACEAMNIKISSCQLGSF